MGTREQIQFIPGFGSRLLERLHSLRMSQTSLATQARVSRQTLHRALHGDEVTARVAKSIAAVVGKDLLSSSPITLHVADRERGIAAPPNAHGDRPALTLGASAAATAPHSDSPRSLTPAGEVLELLREDEGISQEDMARRAKISLSTYRRVITGGTTPKDTWLLAWGQAADLTDPAAMFRLKTYEGATDPFHRAVGRQLHAWRVTAGIDLCDVADSIGLESLTIAMFEIGHHDAFVHLDDLAPLYGTSSEVLFRAARLAAPSEDDETWRPPVERVLTFEAAERSAREQQSTRDQERLRGGWEFEVASELGFIRMRANYSLEEVAKRIGRPKQLVASWEEGDSEPDADGLEQLALIFRTTPWALRYGSPWIRALSFPNAQESRALVFSAILPNEDRAWLYAFLSELARIGLDDVALADVRDSLTTPDYYYDVQVARTPEESVLFLRAKLRERAEEAWRNITDPNWVEVRLEELSPLPTLFDDPTFDTVAAADLVVELGRRRARALMKRYQQGESTSGRVSESAPALSYGEDPLGVLGPPFTADPFSYYRPRLTPSPSRKETGPTGQVP